MHTTDVRETPEWLFQKWDAQFHFTLDACALPHNAKCDRYFTPEQDGLAQDWGHEVVWCNPPYGRAIGRWLQKVYEASKAGATVVCLIPSRHGPGWWRTYVEPYAEVQELGRLKFVGQKHNAPFDSALAIYRPGQTHTRNRPLRT
jgi:phage N-6-adenine-methyltransferase